MNIVVYLLTHALGTHGQFELVTRIKEMVATEKCSRNSYDLRDAATLCVVPN